MFICLLLKLINYNLKDGLIYSNMIIIIFFFSLNQNWFENNNVVIIKTYPYLLIFFKVENNLKENIYILFHNCDYIMPRIFLIIILYKIIIKIYRIDIR